MKDYGRNYKKPSTRKIFFKYFIVGFLVTLPIYLFIYVRFQEPVVREAIAPTITLTATPSATPTPKPETSIEGEASYYSVAGCLGCSPTLTMANGERLDDSKLTIALTPEMVSKYKLLNDTVKVTNVDNGAHTYAKVTDTGGFAKYNRVADLSLATKEAILCPSLCIVKVSWE